MSYTDTTNENVQDQFLFWNLHPSLTYNLCSPDTQLLRRDISTCVWQVSSSISAPEQVNMDAWSLGSLSRTWAGFLPEELGPPSPQHVGLHTHFKCSDSAVVLAGVTWEKKYNWIYK